MHPTSPFIHRSSSCDTHRQPRACTALAAEVLGTPPPRRQTPRPASGHQLLTRRPTRCKPMTDPTALSPRAASRHRVRLHRRLEHRQLRLDLVNLALRGSRTRSDMGRELRGEAQPPAQSSPSCNLHRCIMTAWSISCRPSLDLHEWYRRRQLHACGGLRPRPHTLLAASPGRP